MIVIHHNDLDGRCSAWIVTFKYPDAKCIEMNYDKKLDIDKIDFDEEVYIVDFSFENKEEWDKLFEKTKNVTWIDHHKSAIERFEYLDNTLKGIRKIGESGCLLTWKYIYGNHLPKVVKLINDYDVWNFEFGDDTKHFYYGSKLENNKNINDPIWFQWFHNEKKIEETIRKGKLIHKYNVINNASQVRCLGWFTKFEGYKCIACNGFAKGSTLFDSIDKEYDIKIVFNFDGEKYTVSLYSDTVDVSKICMKYGGGGHAGAGGFHCNKLPFTFKRRV